MTSAVKGVYSLHMANLGRYPRIIVPLFPDAQPSLSREEREARETEDSRFKEERERRERWHPFEGIARREHESEHPHRPVPPVTPPRIRL